MSNVICDSIESKRLGKTKTIYLCLPDSGYDASRETEIIYMHDGHNLFFEDTSAFGRTWKADEAVDDFHASMDKQIIIVGIANASVERYNEYSPWPFDCRLPLQLKQSDAVVGGQGKSYVAFIVDELMPYMEITYGFNHDHVSMAGSSMGALITLYAGFEHPRIFKKLGLFSPAFWFSKKQIDSYVDKKLPIASNVFMSIGHQETSDETIECFPHIYLEDARELHDMFQNGLVGSYVFHEVTTGRHHEDTWREMFPMFLRWVTSVPDNHQS